MGTRRGHTPEQITRKLREAERLLGEGRTVAGITTAGSRPTTPGA